MRHVILDTKTGKTQTEGRSKRRYSQAEVERAERAARDGDVEAKAILDDIDLPDGTEIDWLEHIRDCPECRAAMEAGEVPEMGTGAELFAKLRRRAQIFGRRPRWRNLKRRV